MAFQSLFELLKYFPGRLEPVATVIIPGLVIILLLLLPFLDRRPDREPAKRPLVVGGFCVVLVGITPLTVLGYRSMPTAAPAAQQAAAQPGTPGSGQRGPVMVEDVFKNVQALKGITVDEFMGTMGLMSASLGLCCSDCHPGAGTESVKWEDDSNPRKVTACQMVRMVQAINRDNFSGRQVVTCWTCHHLRDIPLQPRGWTSYTARRPPNWTTSSREPTVCRRSMKSSTSICRLLAGQRKRQDQERRRDRQS